MLDYYIVKNSKSNVILCSLISAVFWILMAICVILSCMDPDMIVYWIAFIICSVVQILITLVAIIQIVYFYRYVMCNRYGKKTTGIVRGKDTEPKRGEDEYFLIAEYFGEDKNKYKSKISVSLDDYAVKEETPLSLLVYKKYAVLYKEKMNG